MTTVGILVNLERELYILILRFVSGSPSTILRCRRVWVKLPWLKKSDIEPSRSIGNLVVYEADVAVADQ